MALRGMRNVFRVVTLSMLELFGAIVVKGAGKALMSATTRFLAHLVGDANKYKEDMYYAVYGVEFHMRNTFSILRHMLGYTNGQQLRHQCHLLTLGVQVRLLISLA